MNDAVAYGKDILPAGIRSRFIEVEGGRLHVLEAGNGPAGRPSVLLLHGFPELAFCWRHQLVALAEAGFHVLAPDLRGYGLSCGAGTHFTDDLSEFSPARYVDDMLALIRAYGIESAAVVGHDWGSPVAAWCTLAHPEIFRAVVLMSSPFDGIRTSTNTDIDAELAVLARPRKHYLQYYATAGANQDMWHAPQGVHNFLRAYYHFKSADWPANQPHRLSSASAQQLATLPNYYIMDRDRGMADTVAEVMPTSECHWLTEPELRVCSSQFARTGFQGGLQLYRVAASADYERDLASFGRDTIDVPSCFIAGVADWGVFQSPGAFEAMQSTACTQMQGVHLIERAGHWVQQEQPDRVNQLLIEFLRGQSRR